MEEDKYYCTPIRGIPITGRKYTYKQILIDGTLIIRPGD